MDVLYEMRPGEEPLVHAVRFTSNKTGQTHRAYRFQAAGDNNPRYYLPSGEELELRLEHSPLDDYEQVTSLLRDGRRHKGVDFKTAVGTPVKAPFTGVVRRKNWNFRFNGNCVELEEVGGKRRRALFLHLDELPRSLKVGDRFAVGSMLGRSGNTGRSFAPHLHYQLDGRRRARPGSLREPPHLPALAGGHAARGLRRRGAPAGWAARHHPGGRLSPSILDTPARGG